MTEPIQPTEKKTRERKVWGRLEVETGEAPETVTHVVEQMTDGIHVHTKKCRDERVIPLMDLINGSVGRQIVEHFGSKWEIRTTGNGWMMKKVGQDDSKARLITPADFVNLVLGQGALDFSAQSPVEQKLDAAPVIHPLIPTEKGKIRIGPSDVFSDPQMRPGWSRWIESGVWFCAPTVDPEKFGGHAYGDGTGECPCGCSMYSASSGGPVDPFGACPSNPLPTYKQLPL